MTLLELAERCEQVSGSDRQLDAEIDIVVRGFPERAYNQAEGMRPKGSPPLDRIKWFISWGAARYTASLDAAMTLVPEGWGWVLCNYDHVYGGNENREARVWLGRVAQMGRDIKNLKAATPALAICAAALRARAAQVDGRRMVETRSGSMRSTTSPVVAPSDDAPNACDPSPNSSQDRV